MDVVVTARGAVIGSAVFGPDWHLRFELDYDLSADAVPSCAVPPFLKPF